MKVFCIAICLIVLFSSPLCAQGLSLKPYTGIDYLFIMYSSEDIYLSFHAIGVKYGTLITPNFAIEGRYATGVYGDTFNVPPYTYANFDINYICGIYGRLIAPVSNMLDIYAIAGHTWEGDEMSSLEFGTKYYSKFNEQDTSFGLGIEVNFTNRLTGSIEYMRLIDKGDYDYSAMSGALKIYF